MGAHNASLPWRLVDTRLVLEPDAEGKPRRASWHVHAAPAAPTCRTHAADGGGQAWAADSSLPTAAPAPQRRAKPPFIGDFGRCELGSKKCVKWHKNAHAHAHRFCFLWDELLLDPSILHSTAACRVRVTVSAGPTRPSSAPARSPATTVRRGRGAARARRQPRSRWATARIPAGTAARSATSWPRWE